MFSINQNIIFRKGNVWESVKIVRICKESRLYLLRDNKGQIFWRNSSQIRQSNIKIKSVSRPTYISDSEEEGGESGTNNDDDDDDESINSVEDETIRNEQSANVRRNVKKFKEM